MTFKRNNFACKEKKFLLASIVIFVQCIFYYSADGANICEGVSEIGKTFQDPEDCTSYYECMFGEASHITCDTGKRYDKTTESCVEGKCPPCECDSGATTPSIQPTTEVPATPSESTTPTDSPTTEVPATPSGCTTDSTTTTEVPTPTTPCPTGPYCQSGEHLTFHRDRADCRKYYVCRHGEAYPYKCINGMSFDTTTNLCNYDSLVNCVVNENCKPDPNESSSSSSTSTTTTTTTPTTTPTTTTTTTPTTTTTTTPTTTSTTTTTPTPTTTTTTTSSTTTTTQLPPYPSDSYCGEYEHGTFHRDKSDCRKYYVCRHGEAVPHYCDQGLHFDDVRYVCNYPSLVGCTPSVMSEFSNSNSRTCIPSPDCTGRPNGFHSRDATDCSKFYYCRNGQLLKGSCKDGKYLDLTLNTCSYPNLVDCKLDTYC